MEHIGRYVVGTFGVHWVTIHKELETTSSGIQLNCPDSVDLANAVDFFFSFFIQ